MKRALDYLLIKKLGILAMVVMALSCSSPNQAKNQRNTGSLSDEGPQVTQASPTDQTVDMKQYERAVLNIPYANTSNPRQSLDIIYPKGAKAPYPVIMVLYSEGWSTGDKQSVVVAPILDASFQGYAVVSVNYRLSGEVRWPKPLHDVKAAIRFLRARGDQYELNTQRLVVWGVSTGGHLALMLGATNDLPAYEDLSMGNANSSSVVQGVIVWRGVSDLSTLSGPTATQANILMGYDVKLHVERAREASPVALATRGFPPLRLLHGTDDQIIPFSQSDHMAKAVNSHTGKHTVELLVFIGDGHTGGSIGSVHYVNRDLDFVDRILYSGKNPYRNDNGVGVKIVQ